MEQQLRPAQGGWPRWEGVSLEVDQERVGLVELMASGCVEGEGWEKMVVHRRLEVGTLQLPSPKPRPWTSGYERASTFVVCRSLNLHQEDKCSRG